MAQLMLGTKKVLMQVVHEGRSLSTLFDAFNEVERPAIQSLTYATLRDWTHAQIRLYKHLSKKPSKELDVLLTVAAMLIHNRGRDQNQYAVPTIVNEAVKAAAMSPKTKHAQGLTNAVLRKVASTTLCQAEMHGQFGLPFPDWWLRRIRTAYPDQWESICRRQQEPPPLTLRVNQMMNTRVDYETKLERSGIAYQTISEIAGIPLRSALMIDVPLPVSQLPEFMQGAVSVQDAGAQLAPGLLCLQKGERLLDACAAPGGKTAHLLETVRSEPGELIALEIDTERTKKIVNTLTRLQLINSRIQVITGDASQPDWWDGNLFDKILLDVPCSASGIVRRHPDIVFLRKQQDIVRLVEAQRAILENVWMMLKNGGTLLYLTCSIFPEEGEEQITRFVMDHPNALRLEAPGQLLPSEHHDGFFYGLLKKHQP
ncbi:MAG: 16S rRNA (cytosine(967)-C(5))-methyltransferase RsmB [Burkholderiaceae bacterium]|nr:16S rRNA (cytosine(967)-C(5))-methyltransferase RsmB [Burkholderiaceae bacterium]